MQKKIRAKPFLPRLYIGKCSGCKQPEIHDKCQQTITLILHFSLLVNLSGHTIPVVSISFVDTLFTPKQHEKTSPALGLVTIFLQN